MQDDDRDGDGNACDTGQFIGIICLAFGFCVGLLLGVALAVIGTPSCLY